MGSAESNDKRAHVVRLANMRQELASPVAAIVGYAEMLSEETAAGHSEELVSDLGKILIAAHQLSEMVDEFLDPAKSQRLFASSSIDELQKRIRHDLRTPINGIKGYAEMLLEDMSDGESDSLRQDIENLLNQTNSLLSRLGDIVNFSNVTADSDASDEIGFTTDSMTSEILKSIKPVAESPEQPEDTGNILIVDDIEANRDLLSRQLTRQGHTVTTVSNGPEALETLQTGSFDLVLLDLMMPGMSGYEVLARMKQDESLRNIPVIMISALDEVDSVVRCIEAGADDYLNKPVNPTLLKARIKSGLEAKQWLDTERQQRRFIRRAFSRFLAQAVVDALVEDPSKLELGGERVEITCLFTDLEGFTSLIEGAEPSKVLPLLNRYLDNMCRIVLDHGGTIDKIVGDALHVFFGAPLPQADHATLAVDCALAMDDFARSFMHSEDAQALNFGRTRIGVHTGFAVVGNFGGESFFDYTAHGDTVNTAARMESANKHLGTRICVSGETVSKCSKHEFRPVGTLMLKGKSEGVEAFEPLGASSLEEEATQAYREAYELMRNRDELAPTAFEELRRRYPGDALAACHARRLAHGEIGTKIIFAEK
jgi:class 3 adenylate cyclase